MQMKIMQTDEIYHFVYSFLQSSCCIVKPQIEPAPNELDHKLILFNLMPQQKKKLHNLWFATIKLCLYYKELSIIYFI